MLFPRFISALVFLFQLWTRVMSPPRPPVLPTMFPMEMTLPFTLEEEKELRRLVRYKP